MKTETNRRTATDEFTLTDGNCRVSYSPTYFNKHCVSEYQFQDYFSEFGDFLDRKISEFEGQFWNDPDWFFGGVWPEQGFDTE